MREPDRRPYRDGVGRPARTTNVAELAEVEPDSKPKLAAAASVPAAAARACRRRAPAATRSAGGRAGPRLDRPIKPVPVQTVVVKLAPPKTAPAAKAGARRAGARRGQACPGADRFARARRRAGAGSRAGRPAKTQAAPLPPPGARPGILGVLARRRRGAGKAIVPAASAAEPRTATRSGWAIQIGAFEAEAEAKERLNAAQSKASNCSEKGRPLHRAHHQGREDLLPRAFRRLRPRPGGSRLQAAQAQRHRVHGAEDLMALKI